MLDVAWISMYFGYMETFEIINAETNEVAAVEPTWLAALAVAESLSSTTKVLHFVPVRHGDGSGIGCLTR